MEMLSINDMDVSDFELYLKIYLSIKFLKPFQNAGIILQGNLFRLGLI